mmetsp:Transcript_2647/g.8706  ORF Transcript_2647/g.8706 Transcript_2647/m.8706 type:complete len:274 (-) Transcript_2647:626-1447(-)
MLVVLYGFLLFRACGFAAYSYTLTLRSVCGLPGSAATLSALVVYAWCFLHTLHTISAANMTLLSSTIYCAGSAAVGLSCGIAVGRVLVRRRAMDNQLPWPCVIGLGLALIMFSEAQFGSCLREDGGIIGSEIFSALLGTKGRALGPNASKAAGEAEADSGAYALFAATWFGWFMHNGQPFSLGKQHITFHSDGQLTGFGEMNQQRINMEQEVRPARAVAPPFPVLTSSAPAPSGWLVAAELRSPALLHLRRGGWLLRHLHQDVRGPGRDPGVL